MTRDEFTLGANQSVRINTPEGVVYVMTILGTQVAVYDDPNHNPVGMITLRERRQP